MPPPISIIIPAVNEFEHLRDLLPRLLAEEERAETIVADGGSADDTESLRSRFPAVTWVNAARGRGTQMNAGAAVATGDILLFLHVDTSLPEGWPNLVRETLTDPRIALGAFRFRVDGRHPGYRLLELGVRLRCAWFHRPYGDQAFFTRTSDFHAVNGFPDWPLFEDVELVARMKERGRVVTLPQPAVTSARRWKANGILRQTRLNRSIMRAYRAGTSAAELARRYHGEQDAIVVFCKHPDPGKVKTRLAETIGEEEAVKIYREMVGGTLRTLEQCATPATSLVFFAPAADRHRVATWLGDDRTYVPQVEGDLGDRMLAAFRHALAHGFERVLVIGTDCPGLTSDILDQAFTALNDHELVLGPTTDGGYYLIGARSDHEGLFKDMPWSTPQVRQETMDRARRLELRTAILPTLRDVDRADDMAYYRSSNR